MLLPGPVRDLDDAGIDAAYAWPDDRMWLRANMVSSVDGAAQGPDGKSGEISTPADKRLFGMLRGLADAVLVGATTVRTEQYRAARPKPAYAERRAAAGQRATPVVAVVSRSLDLDVDGPLFVEPVERPLVLTVAAADPVRAAAVARVADVVACGETDVDLEVALGELAARGLRRVHAEGGPHLLAQLVAGGHLDELLLTVSPVLSGGDAAIPLPRILAGTPLPDSPGALTLAHVLESDGALFLRYRVAR